MGVEYVPDTELTACNVQSYLIFTKTLWIIFMIATLQLKKLSLESLVTYPASK